MMFEQIMFEGTQQIESNDWKWYKSDYPTKKMDSRFLAVFLVQVEAQWGINLQDVKLLEILKLTPK